MTQVVEATTTEERYRELLQEAHERNIGINAVAAEYLHKGMDS